MLYGSSHNPSLILLLFCDPYCAQPPPRPASTDDGPTLDDVPETASEPGAFTDVPGSVSEPRKQHKPAAQSLSEYVEHMPAHAAGGQYPGMVHMRG